MRLCEALKLKCLGQASLVVAGNRLDGDVRWIHVVEIPDPAPWLGTGQVLLTTGYAWPREADQQRSLVRSLVDRGVVAVGLAVPKYFEHFPPAVIREAERAGLPLLEIPWEIPFAKITEELNGAIVAEQFKVIEQGDVIHRELTRAALEAESLQDLARTLGNLIQHAVTFEDSDSNLLGFWNSGEDLDPVRRATIDQGKTPPEVLTQLRELGHLSALRNSAGPMRVPAVPSMGFSSRVACPIWLKSEFVGAVWMVEGERQLSELDLRAAEHAALVAALHIANQRHLAALEGRLGATFLDALLDGRFEPTAPNLERARLLGFDPEESHRVALIVLDEPLPLSREGVIRRDRLADRLRHRLSQLKAMAVTSSQLSQVICLLPEAAEPVKVWDYVSGPGLAMVLGRAHPGAGGVPRSYREAQSVVPYAVPGEIRRYDDMLIPRVLDGDREARQDFLDQLLDRIRSTRGGAVLEHSLLCYARYGFLRNRAAAALHVHPNTLRYRLERASALTGLDLRDPEVRFRLQLAVQLLAAPNGVRP
ncbi:PucR family transcriptional regulator [bacterium]|nr:MAG: PucR family transcriptional regulator [bacterium]